jgi:hypothetical protein
MIGPAQNPTAVVERPAFSIHLLDEDQRMSETLATMTRLLNEVSEHLSVDSQSEQTKARKKLERVSALASTLVLTLRVRH